MLRIDDVHRITKLFEAGEEISQIADAVKCSANTVRTVIAGKHPLQRERRTYTDDRFCDNCQAETRHTCQDSGHERDSSQDRATCNLCGWYRLGLFGEYEPPAVEQFNQAVRCDGCGGMIVQLPCVFCAAKESAKTARRPIARHAIIRMFEVERLSIRPS